MPLQSDFLKINTILDLTHNTRTQALDFFC